ncbi:glycosyltransferase [Bizionia argentinensis JUB59]|uniref:Glycosyltransferase n=1 Tax=Bizionia argentinensis JUB59 TaxID=1046627 RepID=G2EGQ0_9FLAO|nr:glycosyltransferase [Bizionia argentinensis]EGV42367.1 glycosyltransferase [Bizionia argentinensis JUB59]
MELQFSFIIPVFNRPNEIDELLHSFCSLITEESYEIVIVEDGSTIPSNKIIEGYSERLNITYLVKTNTGPGDSRNYGMRHAQGNYFIILDSDCILPPEYLKAVGVYLSKKYIHCFGGPDAAHESFNSLQKAINFSMTSFITTGGIRGNKTQIDKFQPRSFNMGLSKEAFLKTGGFGNIHPGEDPDLTIRLWNLGYETALISEAFVYHKRRISWAKFYKQVSKFGSVRPILNMWHPETKKITYWFPSVFIFGWVLALILTGFDYYQLLAAYILYFVLLFFVALISTRNVIIAFQSIFATIIQFTGYGFGFIKSIIILKFSNKKPEERFPDLFFKNK